ncbi:MAG: tripartite tricarboxylate transporter TctB family protein [Thermodesulfobacteriota bacterium]
MKRADIGVGIGLIILSTWVFWYANVYREKEIYIYGPNFFPQILSVLMGLCGIILIIRAMRGEVLPKTDRIDIRGFLRMVIAIGMCIGYLFLMQGIGFAMGTSVFLFVLMTFLGQQGLTIRIMSSMAASVIVWAIFRYFLVIPLPTGMFEFTF